LVGEAFGAYGDCGSEFLGEELDAEFFEHPAVADEVRVEEALAGVALSAFDEFAPEGLEFGSVLLVALEAVAGEFAQAGDDGGEVAWVVGEPFARGDGEEAGAGEDAEVDLKFVDGRFPGRRDGLGEAVGDGVVGVEDDGDFSADGIRAAVPIARSRSVSDSSR
jgi:hypothetical protein